MIKVKELLELLANRNPEENIIIRVDGSIYSSSTAIDIKEYNEEDNGNNEYCILTEEEW